MSESVQTSDVLKFLAPANPAVHGEENNNSIRCCKSIFDRPSNTFSFANSKVKNVQELLGAVSCSLILVDREFEIVPSMLETNCLVTLDQPKLWYVRALTRFFEANLPAEIHPTAIVDPSARIGRHVSVGAYSVIGKNCSIGEGTKIGAQVVVHDNATIGEFCEIDCSTVIGKIGWGHVKDENGDWIKFPHLGSVEIGNCVEIGSQVSIDRGALSITKIGDNTKIDSHAHIGHNSVIGKNCMILGKVLISGSCVIGNDVWLGAGTTVADQIEIGDEAFVTIGSTVVSDVKAGMQVTGYFARDHKKYLAMMLDEQRKYFR